MTCLIRNHLRQIMFPIRTGTQIMVRHVAGRYKFICFHARPKSQEASRPAGEGRSDEGRDSASCKSRARCGWWNHVRSSSTCVAGLGCHTYSASNKKVGDLGVTQPKRMKMLKDKKLPSETHRRTRRSCRSSFEDSSQGYQETRIVAPASISVSLMRVGSTARNAA